MPASNFVDSWLQMFSSSLTSPTSVHLPGSGNIGGFTYQPYTVWEAPSLYRGNSTLEQSIYTEVASPGKQLGKLIDAVMALAHVVQTDSKTSNALNTAIEELKPIADQINNLKAPHLNNIEQTARDDLDKLLRTNKKSLHALLTEYSKKLDKESGTD
ncbi:MAG: hypothetical protein JWM78_1113 [Verrucomicrobiaceae bacterium]|nr:hypothetical protein [Verrucomicrobiaceae bacterium]